MSLCVLLVISSLFIVFSSSLHDGHECIITHNTLRHRKKSNAEGKPNDENQSLSGVTASK